MTSLELIKAARKRIEDPKHWCQKASALTGSGSITFPQHTAAVCWCATGALGAENSLARRRGDVSDDQILATAIEMIQKHNRLSGGIAGYNDNHTHAEVLALFDKTIAAEEMNK